MLVAPYPSKLDLAPKIRNVLFVLLGIALLLSKRWYSGPLSDIVHAYLGNVSVSFAIYFLFANLELPQGFMGILAAGCAFTVVELFEAFDGFGVMSNTYDPIDFLANALGIAVAFLIDTKLRRRHANRVKPEAPSPEQE